MRFVAVSATVPNLADVAAWLGAPPRMTRSYGEELRPVRLTTSVRVRRRWVACLAAVQGGLRGRVQLPPPQHLGGAERAP